MTDEVDVLVVGAGPTGLTAAIELARRGVQVSIVDKAPARPYEESRAEGLHAKSLEIFERQGLLDAVLGHGRVLAGFSFWSGGRRLGELSAGRLDSPHAYAVLLPQSEVERLQREHLAGLGVNVQRPMEVVGVEQSATHVLARVRTADGTDTTMRARYLVAADGGHSAVRAALGVPFPGDKLQGAYVMDAEAEFATEPPADRGTFVLARGGFVVIGRRPDGSHRIALSLPAQDPRISRERPDRDQLQRLLDDFPEVGIRLRSISWSSAFFLSSRAVGRLRHGRVFLAGDAAHIHSPVGGQGMNTGIQDAVNLGWKLAAAVRTEIGDPLLNTYDAERLPVIRRLIASTTASTKPLLWRNPVATAARDGLLRVLLAVPRVQTALFDDFTGFSVRYRTGALVPAERLGRRAAGPQPGEVAPEAGSAGRRWYPLWGNDTRHQLLIFGDDDAAVAPVIDFAARHPGLVRPLVVQSQPRDRGAASIPDPTGALRRRYGVSTSGTSCLVRPDGYIAARDDGANLEPLRTYFDTFLPMPAAAVAPT